VSMPFACSQLPDATIGTRALESYSLRAKLCAHVPRPQLPADRPPTHLFLKFTLSPFSILAVTRGFVFLPTDKVQFMSESFFIYPKLDPSRSRRSSSPGAFP